jgi:hypothetical protein
MSALNHRAQRVAKNRIPYRQDSAAGRVGGLNRINSNGSDDVLLSDTKDISPIAALALPSAGATAVRMEARLSAFTIMLRLTEGSSAVPYSLCGNARNNPAILRAWDRFSQFIAVTRKTLDCVEFIVGIVDGMRAVRQLKTILARC